MRDRASKSSQYCTQEHDRIRAWAEKHDGSPVRVRGTRVLALRMERQADERRATSLEAARYEPIAWDEWFGIFDADDQMFVCDRHGYDSKVVRHSVIDRSTDPLPDLTHEHSGSGESAQTRWRELLSRRRVRA